MLKLKSTFNIRNSISVKVYTSVYRKYESTHNISVYYYITFNQKLVQFHNWILKPELSVCASNEIVWFVEISTKSPHLVALRKQVSPFNIKSTISRRYNIYFARDKVSSRLSRSEMHKWYGVRESAFEECSRKPRVWWFNTTTNICKSHNPSHVRSPSTIDRHVGHNVHANETILYIYFAYTHTHKNKFIRSNARHLHIACRAAVSSRAFWCRSRSREVRLRSSSCARVLQSP